jgi:hypothetical protein
MLRNYFNPAFSWYGSLFGPSDFQTTLSAFPIVLQGSGANAPFTTVGGLDNTWSREGGRHDYSSMTILPGVLERMNYGLGPILESSG